MKRYLFSIFLLSLALPSLAFAASAVVKIDTGHEMVNALEGTLNVPSGISVDKIYNGDSRLVIWIQTPTFDSGTHSISFSGITPGGFQGVGPIFSLSGNFSNQDLNKFTFSKVRALRNDGAGTTVPVKLSVAYATVAEDTTPPESFTPVISVSQTFFDSKPFVSFATLDKGTGIDHYEYALTRFFPPSEADWRVAQSPLVLEKTDLSHRIFIKAVDKSGNERISTVVAFYHYEYLALWAIILVLLICVLVFTKRFLF